MSVLTPNPNAFYLDEGNFGFMGPFLFEDGRAVNPWIETGKPMSHTSDFREGPGIASENSVFHSKHDVAVQAFPFRSGEANTPIQPHLGWHGFKGSFRNFYNDRVIEGNYYPKPSFTPAHTEIGGPRTFMCLIRENGWRELNFSVDSYWNNTTYWYGVYWDYEIIAVSNNLITLRTGYTSVSTSTPGRDTDLSLVESFFTNTLHNAPSAAKGSTSRTPYYAVEKTLNMSEIMKWASDVMARELSYDHTPVVQSYGDLTHAAVKNLDANSANMIAFIRDLKDVKSLIPKLKELTHLSTHANNYLAVQYGVLPTISDLQAIWDAFQKVDYRDRSGNRRVSAYDTGHSSTRMAGITYGNSLTRRVHIAVNTMDTGIARLMENVREAGFFPSLTNIWDLIPYSFVINWFVDVGSVLERIDTNHRLLNLDIPYTILSDKLVKTYSLSNDKLGASLTGTFTSYSRNVSRTIPQPRIFGEIDRPPTALNHWVEGTALLVQRTNK